jgi:two-component system NarL family sensor kinase
MFRSLYNWATQQSKLGFTDSALIMFKSCAELAKKIHCDGCLADVYNNQGEILFHQKRFAESLQQYEKMAVIAKTLNDPEYDLYLYMNRGNTLAAQGKYRQANADLVKAQAIGSKLSANFELSQILLFRSDLAEKTGDFKEALFFRKRADSLKAKVASDKSLSDIHRLDVQYRTSEKDRSIAEQKVKLAKRQAAIRKKDMINTGLFIGCLLLAAIVFLAYRNIRHRRRLSVQQWELHEQKINELQKERQLVAAQSLMKGQEEERSRLARDLHDGVGGLLSGVKLSLSTMKGNVFLTEESAKAVTTIIGQLDSSITELRRVSHNMMPEALIRFGLKEALENYCENIDRSGVLKVRLQTYGLEKRMDQDTEIILYRTLQELLNNVVKHAAAREVLIQLIRDQNKFTLTVEDDGKGFDIHSPEFKSGAGLQNIQARAGYLNGVVDIRTAPGEGTSVTIEGLLS